MGPDKRSGLVNQLEKREGAFTQFRDEPTKRCEASRELLTFFTWAEGRIFSTALIFFGLSSIPWCETKKSRSFPTETSKSHFSGLRIMRGEHNLSKTWSKLWCGEVYCLDLTTMSSTYTSIMP
jgi:hypothetical protein